MNGIIRASLYARVSSQKQADENTIDSQREAIRERIQNDGLHLSNNNTFCDDGYSGTELLRPGLEKLRDRIAASLIDRLYIHSPDRLSRAISCNNVMNALFMVVSAVMSPPMSPLSSTHTLSSHVCPSGHSDSSRQGCRVESTQRPPTHICSSGHSSLISQRERSPSSSHPVTVTSVSGNASSARRKIEINRE